MRADRFPIPRARSARAPAVGGPPRRLPRHPARRVMSRYDLEDEDLERLLVGEPRYRVAQLRRGLYGELAEPSELTTLSRPLRDRLARAPELARALAVLAEQAGDRGETVKWLFGLRDGAQIETVLMHHARHSTVCVSSQAGCAMGCPFCATGLGGYLRHLSSGEIVEQVVHAARRARADGRRLDHVVFMGMGEPLANFDRVWRAVERIVADLGLAARHLTLSTVGLAPQIRRLADRPLQVGLAVSLHAARDELRDELVPVNRRYPIGALVEACRHYCERTGRRISLEWALIAGVNDTDRDVSELSRIARDLRAHVNLIPLNPVAPGDPGGLVGSPPERVRAFARALGGDQVAVTVRRTRGRSIDAACGQLAARGVPDAGGPAPVHLADTPRRAARAALRGRGAQRTMERASTEEEP